jgi:hypothetical protein
MRYGLACIFGLLFSVSASAVDSTGKVFDIYVHQLTSEVYFRIEGAQLSECATTNRYAIDTSLPGGEILYSFILAAETTGKEVFVRGSDQCVIQHDSEDVTWVKSNS